MMRYCIAFLLVFTIAKSQFAQIRYPGNAHLPILGRHNYPAYDTFNYRPDQTFYAYQPRYQPSYSYGYIFCTSDDECPFGYGCYRNWFYRSNVCWPFQQRVFTAAARTSTTTEIVSTEDEQGTITDETREPTTTMTTTTDDTSTIPDAVAPETS